MHTLSALHFGKRVEGSIGLVQGSKDCVPWAAAELRRIADAIEADTLWLDGVWVSSNLRLGEIVSTTLTLKLTERIP